MKIKHIQSLLKNGYIIINLDNKYFNRISNLIKQQFKKNNIKSNLQNLHKNIELSEVNNLRMNLFKNINKNNVFKNDVYKSAEKFIEGCVGSEICSSDINFSIQMPKDNTSLLEMHTDFFSAESLYQINLWIPFMNVKKTQSMFIIDPNNSYKILKKIKSSKKINFDHISKKYIKYYKWLSLKRGQGLIFSPNCLHGNVVNKEQRTGVSINIRYKNIFSPYGSVENEKKIGSFYKLLSPKAITLFNLKYNFDEIV